MIDSKHIAVLALALPTFVSPPASAQPPSIAPHAEGHPSQDAVEVKSEARRRYRRGMELFELGNFDAATLELRRAYELAPSFRILYNLGLIAVERHDDVASVNAFQRYLDEGGNQVPAERMLDVQARLVDLRQRIAHVSVLAPAGCEIAIDDWVVGTAPLSTTLALNAGRRRVTAHFAGRAPESRVIEVAGGDRATVRFDSPGPVALASPPLARPVPWLWWGTAAALGAAAGVTGILALNARSEHDEKLDTLGITRAQLDAADRKTEKFSVTADALTASALLAGGVAAYLTWRPAAPAHTGVAGHVRVIVSDRGVTLGGRF